MVSLDLFLFEGDKAYNVRIGGSCLVPWFERSDTCPTCRQTVKGTRDEHLTSSIIEKLLNRFPDKKRDPGELEELRLIYKPGQKVIFLSPSLFPPSNSVLLTPQPRST